MFNMNDRLTKDLAKIAEDIMKAKEVVKEGTWHLPDTPKLMADFKKLMSNPIKLGRNGDDAIKALSAVVGDDELYDALYVAGKKNTMGDARDVVKKHMKRLGIKEEVQEVEEATWKSTGHYTEDGKEWDGDQHYDEKSGMVMTGKTHDADSQNLYHYKDLSPEARTKVKIKEEVELDEAGPKIKGDFLKIQRAKDAAHDDAMGRTKTGRKKPERTMTSTQKSMASMRNEEKLAGWIAMFNGKQVEIYKDKDAKDLYSAKLFAIKALNVPKSKQGLLSVEPAYEEVIKEAKADYDIKHKTFSSAIQHAVEVAMKRGYEVDPDDYDRKVAMGPKKPSEGKTNSYSLKLMKDGKEQRKALQVQIANLDNKFYELNMYIQ